MATSSTPDLTELAARLERIEETMQRLLQRLDQHDAAPQTVVNQLMQAVPALDALARVPHENMQHALRLLQRATEPELRDTFDQLLGNLPPLATALLALPSDEATLDFLIRATQTFSQIIQNGPPRVGWFSAWRATREVNVQAAIGLALSFARGIGECLEQPIKQLPTYTRRLKNE